MLAALFVTKYLLDLVLNVAQICVTAGWLWLGTVGVRREDKTYMQIFAGLTVLQPLYIASKLHAVHTDSSYYPQYTYEQFWAVAWMAVGVRIGVLVWARFCYKNFGGGLKERLWDRSNNTAATAAAEGTAADGATKDGLASSAAALQPKRVRVIRVHDSEMTDMSSAAAGASSHPPGLGLASAPIPAPASRLSYPHPPMLHDYSDHSVADSAPRAVPPREFFQQQRAPMQLSSRAMTATTGGASAAASAACSSSAAAPEGSASPDFVIVDAGSVSPPESPLTHSVMVPPAQLWASPNSPIAPASSSVRNESIVK